MEKKTLTLEFIWKIRLFFYAKGDKLWAEGDKLHAEGNKFYAEGDKLWAEAVIEVCGNVTIEWIENGCKLGDGQEFKN